MLIGDLSLRPATIRAYLHREGNLRYAVQAGTGSPLSFYLQSR